MAKKATKKPRRKAKKPQPTRLKLLLDMTNVQARAFLLQGQRAQIG